MKESIIELLRFIFEAGMRLVQAIQKAREAGRDPGGKTLDELVPGWRNWEKKPMKISKQGVRELLEELKDEE